MSNLFVYGTLCHAPLMEIVTGAPATPRRAQLDDVAIYWAAGQSYPVIVSEPGALAQGQVFSGLDAAQLARLDYYEAAFGYAPRDVSVTTETGVETARCYFPAGAGAAAAAGAAWSLADWIMRWGAQAVRAADEVMRYFGRDDPAEVGARFGMIRMRAGSYVAAQNAPSAITPSGLTARDATQTARRIVYSNYFSVEEQDLKFVRHDGGTSDVVTRATFMAADAVIVLPYDPVRDRVLLVEQFRAGPYFRGDPHCWSLEPVAGRIDPGETPEEAARREAMEEARLTFSELLPVCRGYPSPGCSSEYYNLFLGLTDLPDDVAGIAGEESEAEDIQSHLLGFDQFMALIDSDGISAQPTVLLALWLARARDRLRTAG